MLEHKYHRATENSFILRCGLDLTHGLNLETRCYFELISMSYAPGSGLWRLVRRDGI